MKIKRRSFIGTALAGAATGRGISAIAQGPRTVAADDLNPVAVVPLGKDLKISRIGLGTGMKAYNRVSDQIRLGQKHFENIFHYAYDRGVRHFDLADLYGSHAYAARTLKSKPRDSYTIVSKIWWRKGGVPDADKGDADVLVQRFLKELKTDYIDLVYLHCMTSPTWPTEQRRQMDLLEDLKQKGLIRGHGCSFHSVAAVEAAAKTPWVDAANVRINPFNKKTDGKPEKIMPAIKKLHDAGKGVVGMKIIAEGQLKDDSQKIEESVQFAIDSGVVDAMIVGFEQTWQIDDFIARVGRALAKKASTKIVVS